jgi:antitoxin CptB
MPVATSTVQGRMRWRCRRGMLELDLLLERFLDGGYDRLDGHGRSVFVRLLELPDQTLQSWLLGQAVPSDRDVRRIVHLIKTCPPAD